MILMAYREAEHYPLLTQWWAGHGMPAVPPRWLPPLGCFAWDGPPSEGGQPLAACFLYLTGTAVCWIEHLTTNPAAPVRLRVRGVDAVIGELLRIAKGLEHDVAMASTERHGVVTRTVRRHGFQVVPRQVAIARVL